MAFLSPEDGSSIRDLRKQAKRGLKLGYEESIDHTASEKHIKRFGRFGKTNAPRKRSGFIGKITQFLLHATVYKFIVFSLVMAALEYIRNQ